MRDIWKDHLERKRMQDEYERIKREQGKSMAELRAAWKGLGDAIAETTEFKWLIRVLIKISRWLDRLR